MRGSVEPEVLELFGITLANQPGYGKQVKVRFVSVNSLFQLEFVGDSSRKEGGVLRQIDTLWNYLSTVFGC